MTTAEQAWNQIDKARGYVLALVSDIEPADWFRQPPGGVTHIAWQVAHMVMAEYFLTMVRVRGERPEDESLVSKAFLKQFGKGSTPDPNPANNPTPEVILQTLARVHEQARLEVPKLSDAALAEPVTMPHRLFTDKLGSIQWCPMHEMSHAGQIGLIRRLQGKQPKW